MERHGARPVPAPAPGTTSPPRKESRGRVPLPRWLLRVLHVGVSAPDQTPGDLGAPAPRTAPTAPRSRADRFDGFYRCNYAPVVRLAYSLCGSMQVAEELAQEAFVAAHERWHRVAGFDRPDLWVRRVVINRSISFRRREASERRALQRIRERPQRHADPIVTDEAVWQALRELSPRQAEVLALFYVEDQPLSEVAAILGLGEETVKTHLKRGRAALATRLELEQETRP